MADNFAEIDDDDIAVLFDALKAWESKDFGAGVMSDILEVALGDKMTPAAQVAALREKEKRAIGRAQREERSVLLRAKLLLIRNRRRIDRLRPVKEGVE